MKGILITKEIHRKEEMRSEIHRNEDSLRRRLIEKTEFCIKVYRMVANVTEM